MAASGRLITGEPDLQRTPVRTGEYRQIREAFVASPGHKLVSGDWSQIELRVMAHLAQDQHLIAAFTEGRDVHRETAAEIFGVAAAEVTSEQRGVGKTVNFATIYGQGATSLGTNLGIPRPKAKQYIDRFFAHYDGVARWKESTVTEAYLDGFVTTLWKRRRYIPELKSHNFSDRAYGERIATNAPIQGTAADLCKAAMLRIDEALLDRGLSARLVLQIHDELVLEVPDEEVDAVVPLVREHMERVADLAVPLAVEVSGGRGRMRTERIGWVGILVGSLLASAAAADPPAVERVDVTPYGPMYDHSCSGCNSIGACRAVTVVEASSTLREGSTTHAAARVLDEDPATAWCEGVPGDGVGQTLTFTIPAGCHVHGAQVLGGYFKDEARLERNGRIAQLRVRADGGEVIAELPDPVGVAIRDSVLNPAFFDLPARPVSTKIVVVTIESVHPGSKHEDTCVSEVTLLIAPVE